MILKFWLAISVLMQTLPTWVLRQLQEFTPTMVPHLSSYLQSVWLRAQLYRLIAHSIRWHSGADIGATINRLDFSVNNLSNIVEHASATRSRIEDAYYATDSAALWRSNVLQAAGIDMRSQASAQPQQILSLLRA